MRILQKGPVTFKPFKPLEVLLNRINHKLAQRHIKFFPQVVIFSFDHVGLTINLQGRYENDELILLENFIKHKLSNSTESAALDIGANIGNHSIFLSNYFYKTFSFEPNPITFDVLTINSKYAVENKNIYLFNFGLSDKKNSLPFQIDSTNMGGSRVITNKNKSKNLNKQIIIELKKADDLEFLRKEKISLIKIDVEGHELSVLKGAENIIKENAPVILFEQDVNEICDGGSKVLSYLSSLGYIFYTIEKRFYFGESFIARILELFLSSIFGSQLVFKNTKIFQKRSYNMILAMPK
jgi:FkbM family methyltransferase